jgi:hypothetical protein
LAQDDQCGEKSDIGGMNEICGHRARKLPKRDREQSERKR